MSTSRTPCPTVEELARAHGHSVEPQISSHVATCERCRLEWQEVEALRGLARDLAPPPMSAQRVRALRGHLLAAARVDRGGVAGASGAPWRSRLLLAALAAGVLVAAAVWMPTQLFDSLGTNAPVSRGRVQAQDGAQYALAGSQPNEIVRLFSGKIFVDVHKLLPGERFRVVAGVGEVEVRGTAFDVEARDDRLTAVRVLHGRVVVRDGRGNEVTLLGGQRWTLPHRQTVASPRTVAKEVVPSEPAAIPALASSTVPIVHIEGGTIAHAAPAQTLPKRRRAERHRPSLRHPLTVPTPDEGLPGSPPLARAPAREVEAERLYAEGWRALRGQRPAQAATVFGRAAAALADGPLAEDATFWRAAALQRAGQGDLAIPALRSFLKHFGGSGRAGEAATMLGWLLLERGTPREARRWFAVGARSSNPATRRAALRGLSASTPEVAPVSDHGNAPNHW